MSVAEELQSLTPSNIVILYQMDTTPIGGLDIFHFHAGVNAIGSSVHWDGVTYTQFPIEASGFEIGGTGSIPRPKMVVANADGLIGAAARQLGGLEGAKLTRTRTFLKYLDAANFPSGNPSADPGQYIDREVWYVSRRVSENPVYIEYELSASFDLSGIKLPRRQVIQNVCSWDYRSSDCSYAGPPVATLSDQPTAASQLDRCGRRLASCKLRFPGGQVLPFGGFPGAGLTRG
jgi:lambda family phage minor tail protein L